MHHTKRNIITVQSQVASGYLGNNIASLAIQLHGFDPIQIPTVLLSNNVEYPVCYGKPIDTGLMADLLKGIEANHFIEESNFLISGFCYNTGAISTLADFIGETKSNRGYQYIYDPAFGDFRSGGLYVDQTVADHSVASLLPLCDLITPNHFELEYILGRKITTAAAFADSLSSHKILRSKTVVATSIHFAHTPTDIITVAVYRQGEVTLFTAPLAPIDMAGSGDLFTAILAAQLNLSNSIAVAVNKAMDYIYQVLNMAHRQGEQQFNATLLMQYARLLA
ncbi:PfkB family carbohydrate kinase [Chitinophaga qingshengii]|uniref:pyridoxal kinase n=1 Tax=Chitinophaga qingshengii TaxID=1569794 RepID=A0ABR7TH16_9BACT|nr:PfkB family carbohydrate kinase [Chitinophaga qingshengii]MBC9928915.1 bifunctional hydroxymethylpyrimidine kinase/phosphomethylpyrimidine kinase [Chitinophaga qingshengii]